MRMLRRFQQASLLIGPAILASSLGSVASPAIGVPGAQVAVSQAGQARFAVALPLRNKNELDRTGIPGNNGFYGYTTGLWDPVLGLGTPYGRVIAGKPTSALAGIPYITASNP